MADNKDEILSDEELEYVAGGNYVEVLKDLRAMAAVGLIPADQVPANVDASNFIAANRLAYDTWRTIGVTMQGKEGITNTYSLPSDGSAYGNSRNGALNYLKYQSGRGDLDLTPYL